MAKFTFPVSARRTKQAGTTPIPPTSGPPIGMQQVIPGAGYSKAHQILGGIGDVAARPHRHWEDASAYSANVPETMAATGRGDGRDGGSIAWEAESSDILPVHVRNRDVDLIPLPSDQSERLRREGSNASMREHSLSVSQQTSASAMAMAQGLPNKASALLDLDNEQSTPRPQIQTAKLRKKKKKQHGLDLAGLLRGKRGKSPQDDMLEDELDSAGSTPSLGRHHRPWVSSKREVRKEESEPVRPHTSASHKRKKTADVAHLDRMYMHYEATTNRDNPESDAAAEPAEPPVPPLPCRLHAEEDGAWPLQARQPTGPLPPLPLPPGASSETTSISSRQTHGSKRTMQSIKFESDLILTSMLSLSSGSDDSGDEGDEEEMAEGVEAFLLEASQGAKPIMEFATDDEAGDAVGPMKFTRLGDLPGGMVPSIKSSKTKRESYGSTDTYLTVPSQTASRKSAKPSSPECGSLGQSRFSTMSDSTTASTASWASAPRRGFPAPAASPPTSALPLPPKQQQMKQRENSAVSWTGSISSFDRRPSTRSNNSIRTTRSMSNHLNPLSPPTHPHNPHLSSSSNSSSNNSQATSPLTPSSIHDFLRSANARSTAPPPHTSSSSAEASALGSAETSADESRFNANRDSRASINPRFMQVTRQEELLLAALRQKRALMRQDSDTLVDFAHVDYSLPVKGAPDRSDSKMPRSSTQTVAEESCAAQSRDALGASMMSQDEPLRSRRTRDSAAALTRSQSSSARSSATISSRPSAHDSPVSPRSSGRRSEDVPLFLDEGSVLEYDQLRVQSRQLGQQSPSASQARPSFQTTISRSGSRTLRQQQQQQKSHPPPIQEAAAAAAAPCPDIDDFLEYSERAGKDGEGEDGDEDERAGSETDGDADFQFPVPGGRGSINVGVSNNSTSNNTSNNTNTNTNTNTNANNSVLPVPTSRSRRSSLGRTDSSRSSRNGVPFGRRDAAVAISVSIPEDEVCDTPDPMWTNMAPLPPPPAENGRKGSAGAIPAVGVPRPDSPPLTPDDTVRRRKKAARLSAVGGRGGMEPGWWGHDG